jgi:hypothetical protein
LSLPGAGSGADIFGAMIVWLNGTFGTGKTTTATALVAALPGARQWRLDHLAPYRAALPWLRREAGTVVDTAGVDPHTVAGRIAAAVTA